MGTATIRVSRFRRPPATVISLIEAFGKELVERATHVRIRGRFLQIVRGDRRVETTKLKLKPDEMVRVDLVRADWIPFLFGVAVATRDRTWGVRHIETHVTGHFFDLPGVREKIARITEEETYEGIIPTLTWEFIGEARFTELFTSATIHEGIQYRDPVPKPFEPKMAKRIDMVFNLYDYNYPSAIISVPLSKFLNFDTDVPNPRLKAQKVLSIYRRDDWWNIPTERLSRMLKKAEFTIFDVKRRKGWQKGKQRKLGE